MTGHGVTWLMVCLEKYRAQSMDRSIGFATKVLKIPRAKGSASYRSTLRDSCRGSVHMSSLEAARANLDPKLFICCAVLSTICIYLLSL